MKLVDLIEYLKSTGIEDVGLSEVEYNLALARSALGRKFAVFKLGGDTICSEVSPGRWSYDKFSENSGYFIHLHALDMFPSIVFGWGSRLTADLENRSIETRFKDGVRITDEEVMRVVLETATDMGQRIENTLSDHVELPSGIWNKPDVCAYIDPVELAGAGIKPVFEAEPMFTEGHPGTNNGIITVVNAESLDEICGSNVIPIIPPIGVGADGTYFNINGDTAAAALVRTLKPLKYLAVTDEGGVRDSQSNLLNDILLRRDYETLVSQGIVTGGMLKKLDDAKDLIEMLGEDFSVQMVAPDQILGELLTTKGIGTRVRQGYVVTEHSLDEVNEHAFTDLVNSRLGKLSDDYFTRLRNSKNQVKVYTVDNGKGGYKGLGVVIELPEIGPYLDIFVTEGTSGLGNDVMSAILGTRDIYNGKGKPLSWRAQTKSPVNGWYERLADGREKMHIGGMPFTAYHRGMRDAFPKAVEVMESKPLNIVN